MGCTEGYLQNKRQKLRNLLAMATDCDTPDEHYFRENTPNSSSYSHRQQFSHPTSWRHGLPFQRITSKHTADSRHTGCGRRHDHAPCGNIRLEQRGDYYEGRYTKRANHD